MKYTVETTSSRVKYLKKCLREYRDMLVANNAAKVTLTAVEATIETFNNLKPVSE